MQYLNPQDLATAYADAQATARRSWTKYDELERLANNEVRSDLPGNMPRVNDGTLAATVRKIPKRLFAKPMSGTVTATDRNENWVGLLANIIWQTKIIPNATTDATFTRKWKTAVKNSKIYGSQPIYTFLTSHGTYTGADMSLPYVRNVYLEPGKISDLASDYIFMDSWYTKLQAKRLLDKAVEDFNKAQELEMEYEGIWDPAKLKAWYEAGPSGKDSMNMTSQERSGINRNEKGYYKLTTCFNRGYQAPFYTFAPTMAGEVVGTQYNSNPTGDLPIIYLYDEEDLQNPYGRSIVQSSGPTQNVLDNLTQSDVLQTQIGSQPPVNIQGDRSQTNLKSMVYAPAQFWFTGNAQVTPVEAVNPNIYSQLPNRLGLYKSQLQFQTGTFDNSVSSEAGQPGFSKTDKGVQALQSQTNADDNDTLQSIADAFARVAKSMINIHMNNMEGSELLSLEADHIAELAKTDLVPTDENGNPQTNEIEVVWDNVRGTFEFEVDATTSMLDNDQQDAQNIQNALSTISMPVAYYMGQDGWKFNMGEAYRSLLMKMNLQNIDKILIKMTPEEAQAAKQAPFPIIDPPQLRVNTADMPKEYWPGLMQNAGIQPDPQSAAQLSPGFKDQATLFTAQSDAQIESFKAHTQATQAQASMLGQATDTSQVPAPQQPDQSQQPDDSQQTSPQLPQTGQQATAQMSAPNDPDQDADTDQPGQPDADQQGQQAPQQPQLSPMQRMIQLRSQYNVDAETAAGIMAAEDHGLTADQYLNFVGDKQ